MTAIIDAERVLDAFLAPEHDQLADRVIEAALADIARTPQRRALRVPWRFPQMSPVLRVAIVAAVLVAVLGGGAYLLGGSGIGRAPAPTPQPTPSAQSTPTLPSPSAAASVSGVAPGIASFTPYTSPVYGITFGIPDGWSIDSEAQAKWKLGDQDHSDAGPRTWDSFMNPEARDGDQIGLGVTQRPAGPGESITSRAGLLAWAKAHVCDPVYDSCANLADTVIQLCAGRTACGPALLLRLSDSTAAVFAHPDTGAVTIVSLGRPDGFPATARYGGGVQLLESILTTFDVWTPQPGQVTGG